MSRRSSSAPVARTEAAIKSHRAVNGIFASHASQQRKATQDRATGRTWSSAHSGPISSGLRGLFTPSQLNKLREEGRYVDPEGNIVDGAPDERFPEENQSCYLLNAQKQFHQYGRDDPEAAKMALQNVRYSYADALREHRKAQSIIRHERTIPKRRIIDRYVQLTSAQVDLHTEVPGRSAVRNRVRQHEGWVLANPERQELHKGKPLMSRVMAGEFYYGAGDLNPLSGDFVEINKRHVRTASNVSRVANARAPVSTLPSYREAPQPRRTIAQLRTYDPQHERDLLAERGRARASRSHSHGAYLAASARGEVAPPVPSVHSLPVGHRSYLPHGTGGITVGGKVASRVIRASSCHHDHHRSTPLHGNFNGSDTFVPDVWPPQTAQPRSHSLHRSHARYEREY